MSVEAYKLLNRLKSLKYDLTKERDRLDDAFTKTGDRKVGLILEDVQCACEDLASAEKYLANIKNR